MTPAHVVIYALGGGWGHLNRSLALARAFSEFDVKTTILANHDAIERIESDSRRAKLAGWFPPDSLNLVAIESISQVVEISLAGNRDVAASTRLPPDCGASRTTWVWASSLVGSRGLSSEGC